MTSIDLAGAYFHIPIRRGHKKFLRFALEGKVFQHTRLPFGYSLAPRTFSKCVEAGLEPLRRKGLRSLMYLDDWLILASSRQESRAHTRMMFGAHSALGVQSEPQQKRSESEREHYLPGGTAGLSVGPGLPPSSASSRHSDPDDEGSGIRTGGHHGTHHVGPTRAHGVGSCGGSAWSAEHALAAEVDERPAPSPDKGRGPHHCPPTDGLGRATVLEQSGHECQTSSNRLPHILETSLHGCVSDRMGRNLRRPPGERCVGRNIDAPYQLARSEGDISGSVALRHGTKTSSRPGKVGQHHSSILCQPPGRQSIQDPAPGGGGHMDVGRQTSEVPESGTHFRMPQHFGGPAVQDGPTRRVSHIKRFSRPDMGEVWDPGDRPVRRQGESPVSPVVCDVRSRKSSSGSRCTSPPRVASGSTVRISSHSAVANLSTSKVPKTEHHNSDTSLSQCSVVPRTSQTGGRLLGPAEGSNSVGSSGWNGTNVNIDGPSAQSVVSDGMKVRSPTLDEKVRHTIKNARAPSTRRAFEARVRVFEEWCRERALDVKNFSTQQLLCFLQSLLDRGRSVATLKVFIAAIASKYDGEDQVPLFRNQLVSQVMKGAGDWPHSRASFAPSGNSR